MANEKKMEEQIKDIPCSTSLKSFQRNRYFYGKLLTVRDFEDEQRYFIEKQRLINRLIHGEGVVCGLKVEKVENKESFIRITPGVALDCCGREIVMPEPMEIDLSKKISLEDFGDEETITRWVTIRYSACGKEPVPAYSAESSCEETCCYSRIMEGYEIDILKEKPEEYFPSDEEICAVWPNPARVAKKVGPIYFERIMPKVVKKGERFKVTIKIKAMDDIPSLKIEEKLPPKLKVYGSSSFERKDVKKGEEFYHTYWIDPKDIIGKFDITGKILNIPNIPYLDLPGSSVETAEEPEIEKSKKFVEYWIKECPESSKEPAVLLASIKLRKRTSSSFEITEVDNAIIENGEFKKSLVFSNPRLYQLINCVEKELKAALEKDLPKITYINWKHDEEYDWFNEEDRRKFLNLLDKLTITFDRAMDKSTINHKTLNVFVIPYFTGKLEKFGNVEELIVEAEKIYLPVYFIPEDEKNQISFRVGYPTSNENRNKILKAYITNEPITTVYSSRVLKKWGLRIIECSKIIWRMFIQLKGDFVLDVNRNPLDANYLKAELPTGNGSPGGLFESWLNIKFDFNKIENTKKVINTNPGIDIEDIVENVKLTKETTQLILNALTKNKIIYFKEGKYYPLPDPRKTIIVYDGKYNYLEESAEKLKADLRDKGIIAEIKSSDELTEEDKSKYEIVLLRGKDIKSATAEKMREVESKVDWDKSKGDTEIVKNPYIENTNMFIIGGKDKRSIGAAIKKFLEYYKVKPQG